MPSWLTALLIVGAGIVPMLYVVMVRRAERHEREPARLLQRAFIWGAIGAPFVASLLYIPLGVLFVPPWADGAGLLITIVLLAPLIEEPAKAALLPWLANQDRVREPEDGWVYGLTIGFGFAAMEGMLYVAAAIAEGGIATGGMVFALRVTLSTFGHGVLTGLVGYAWWRRASGDRTGMSVGQAMLVAMGLHMLNNALAVGPDWTAYLLPIWAGVELAIFGWAVRTIRRLDRAVNP